MRGFVLRRRALSRVSSGADVVFRDLLRPRSAPFALRPDFVRFSSRQTTPCLLRLILSRMPKSCRPCKGRHMLPSKYVLSAVSRADSGNKQLPLLLQVM